MDRINIGDKIEFTRNLDGVYWKGGIERLSFPIATGDTAVYLGNSAITMLSGQSAGQRMLLEINAPVKKLKA